MWPSGRSVGEVAGGERSACAPLSSEQTGAVLLQKRVRQEATEWGTSVQIWFLPVGNRAEKATEVKRPQRWKREVPEQELEKENQGQRKTNYREFGNSRERFLSGEGVGGPCGIRKRNGPQATRGGSPRKSPKIKRKSPRQHGRADKTGEKQRNGIKKVMNNIR